MSLPRPYREFSEEIPNSPFNFPESYYIETPQGRVIIGENLEVDPETGELSNPPPPPPLP